MMGSVPGKLFNGCHWQQNSRQPGEQDGNDEAQHAALHSGTTGAVRAKHGVP